MALAYHGIRDEKKALEMFAILEDLAGPNPLSRLSNEFGTWGKAKIFYDEMVPVYKKYGFK